MIKLFEKRYDLSRKGAKNLLLSIILQTLFNIIAFLPAVLAFLLLSTQLPKVTNKGIIKNYSVIYYVAAAAVIWMLLFVVHYILYHFLYTKTYTQTAATRISMAERIRKLPLSFFIKRDLPDVANKMMTDIDFLEQIFSHSVPQLYATFISTGILGIMCLVFSPILGGVCLSVIPISLIIYFVSRKFQKRGAKTLYNNQKDASEFFQETFECYNEVHSFNLEDKVSKEFEKITNKKNKDMNKIELMIGVLVNLSIFILQLSLPITAVVGAYLYALNKVTLMTFIGLTVFASVLDINFGAVHEHFAALNMIKERIARMKDLKKVEIFTGSKDAKITNYDLEYENVSFKYPGTDKQVINNLSFKCKQGEVTALVGKSGSGKTTLARLALRFWNIDEGKIKLGGVDISTIAPEILLSNFAIVFQDVTLFDMSVLDNIKIGKENATHEEVVTAAKKAHIHEFIMNLPNGYNTFIGENGARLSGGEKQRLSIARAILKNAPIIILDEASSSLDAKNETLIQKAMSKLIKDKTVIVIAHRLRTVMGADKMIILKDGEKLEEGKPDKLKLLSHKKQH